MKIVKNWPKIIPNRRLILRTITNMKTYRQIVINRHLKLRLQAFNLRFPRTVIVIIIKPNFTNCHNRRIFRLILQQSFDISPAIFRIVRMNANCRPSKLMIRGKFHSLAATSLVSTDTNHANIRLDRFFVKPLTIVRKKFCIVQMTMRIYQT